MYRLILFLILFDVCQYGFSQDMNYVRSVIEKLSSEEMHGRGYVNDGHKVAADFIQKEFETIGLKQLDGSYTQEFDFSINTFPGKMSITADDSPLRAGIDYVVLGSSPSLEGSFNAVWFDKSIVDDAKQFEKFKKGKYSNKVIIADSKNVSKDKVKFFDGMRQNPFGAKVIVMVVDDLTMSLSTKQGDFTTVEILRDVFVTRTKKMAFDIEAKQLDKITSQNVLGYLEGTENPDKYIIFSGHYDHLGRMGSDVYFPGANDNASGIAMLLSIAKYYANPENRPKYSVMFIAFGAEEVGLIGSKYYAENPRFRLMHIKFLVNMDIVGTGDEGITVVNGSILEKEFQLLEKINNEFGYLPVIKKRGKAAISDHHFFTEKGVNAFFIYTLGGIKAYHDVDDKAHSLPLTKFQQVYLLLTDFGAELE